MKSLTGISQDFDKCTKATLQNNYFYRRPPMTASGLKHDHDMIIKSGKSLKLFWYKEVAGRWIEIKIC